MIRRAPGRQQAMLKNTLGPLALAALTLCLAIPSRAQSVSDIISAELLPGWTTPSGTQMTAIRLTLSRDWKTYWRSPGDAGIPPTFNWAGSENIRALQLHWPTPEVFHFNGMQTIGYARELVLPIEVWPDHKGQPIRLKAEVDLGVCRDICVPATLTLASDLQAARKTDNPTIRAALKARPATAREAGVRSHRCTVSAVAGGLRVRAEIDMVALGPDEVVVIETANPSVWVSEATTRRDGSRLVAETDLVAHDRKPFALDRSGLTISVLAQGRAVELSGCPAP